MAKLQVVPTESLLHVLDYLEFSVGKLREVARSFGIIFSLSSQKVLVWFCRRTSYCISGGIFADTHTHDPLGALDCNSNRVLPSFHLPQVTTNCVHIKSNRLIQVEIFPAIVTLQT